MDGNIQVLPDVTASLALTPASSVVERLLVQGSFDGAAKSVQLANVHGTLASNAVGSVQLRPSVRLTEKDLREWIAACNENPKPFVWTKTADAILNSLAKYIERISGAA